MQSGVAPAYPIYSFSLYFSQPTEYGTVYSHSELAEMRVACDSFDLTLFVDGARLGYGLAASDVTLPVPARLTDVFTIGRTKCGAAFGEAIVFATPHPYFRNAMKQSSGLLGAQFEALFTDGLYESITAHANEQAARIASAGIRMLSDSPTNQQFALLTPDQEAALSGDYVCQFFEEHGSLRAVPRATRTSTRSAPPSPNSRSTPVRIPLFDKYIGQSVAGFPMPP
ncbi:hypothetical protein CBE89_11260 [Corynebacterium striatum]|uniref:Uncharacterized protein n=1 Tax=Corynebacterium striatum TaxID=43770 RepID=A0A2Z2J612_CORST|nr:beta-eliminating lyase-related protein [Corynebacterium striatum]ART22007.1 hypothetical protein CBE89_11260 [Corynebacterium striatum]